MFQARSGKETNMELDWVTVCDVSDLKVGAGVCVLVEDRQAAIFYLGSNDSIYAIDNYDPFGQANVLSRGIVGDIGGDLVVASPLHKQHFKLETGICVEDESVKVATFPVRLDDKRVQMAVV